MKAFFQRTKQLKPLGGLAVMDVVQEVCPSAFVDSGRPLYLPVVIEDLREWLLDTQVDRYRWREAQPQSDTVEMVCASFSALLWGLIEQERLRGGCLWPLAVARVRLYSHSLVGFVSEEGMLMFIEPQDDAVTRAENYVGSDPDRTVQSVVFV